MQTYRLAHGQMHCSPHRSGFIDRYQVPVVPCTGHRTNKHQQTTHCWITSRAQHNVRHHQNHRSVQFSKARLLSLLIACPFHITLTLTHSSCSKQRTEGFHSGLSNTGSLTTCYGFKLSWFSFCSLIALSGHISGKNEHFHYCLFPLVCNLFMVRKRIPTQFGLFLLER